MKVKAEGILYRLKFAWWGLFHEKKFMIVEKCERCGSNNIEIGGSHTVKQEDGTHRYYAKYFCRKCGASCYTEEVWEDNAIMEE